MPAHDPDSILKSLRTDRARLCFYPSCGTRSPWVVARLDADVFIFSDKLPKSDRERERFRHAFQEGFLRHGLHPILEFTTVRTCFFRLQDKLMFLFFQDNNQALARIHDAGWQISTFVGICDGCCEGGNYECVHADPFLSKLLATSADGMDYITDHSQLLASHDGRRPSFRRHVAHPSGWEFSLQSLLFRDLEDARDPYKVLHFPDRRRLPTASSDSPLARLRPIRESYHASMLVHYHQTFADRVPMIGHVVGGRLDVPRENFHEAGGESGETSIHHKAYDEFESVPAQHDPGDDDRLAAAMIP